MPRAIDVRLRRQISMGVEIASRSTGWKHSSSVPYESMALDVQNATWWPTASGTNNRLLMGEIHLARDLRPSCRVGPFELSVSRPNFSHFRELYLISAPYVSTISHCTT